MIPRPYRIQTHCKRGHKRPEPRKPCAQRQKYLALERKTNKAENEAYLEKRRKQWRERYYRSEEYRKKVSKRNLKYKQEKRKEVKEKAKVIAKRLLEKAGRLAMEEKTGVIRK